MQLASLALLDRFHFGGGESGGTDGSQTRRWRKPDSNPWSHTWKRKDYVERELEIGGCSRGPEVRNPASSSGESGCEPSRRSMNSSDRKSRRCSISLAVRLRKADSKRWSHLRVSRTAAPARCRRPPAFELHY